MKHDTMNRKVTLVAMALLGPAVVSAATVDGIVRDAHGAAVQGALVTATSADGLYAETVYSNKNGYFRLATRQAGSVTVRARKAALADASRQLALHKNTAVHVDLQLAPLGSPEAISDSLSASAHFARLRFADAKERQWMQVECLTCHQIGNAFTRTPRPREQWTEIVTKMFGYYGVKDATRISHYVDILSQAFDGSALQSAQYDRVDASVDGARVMEWKLPQGTIAHDVEYNPADRKFYTVDQGNDQIYITDPVRLTTETFVIPTSGMPVGGKFFTALGDPNPFGLTVKRGPHSLQRGPNGHYYTTDTVSGQIGEFDPLHRTYVGHEIGGKALYPHTLRFDRKGRVWFTLGVSNQVGYYDTVNDQMKLIEVPPDTDRPSMQALMPYGIDVNPVDGSVWYSSLMANRIGRIDPETLKVTVFTPPTLGPRRMRFAADGTLWIPSFGDGKLVRLDTKTMQYHVYPIPTLAPNEVEAPYAVGVHPKTQEVWITANMSDRVFRFLPKSERFVTYPLPARGTYLRDIVFTPEGWVCAASSPVPAPVTVEGGMQEILCVDPSASRLSQP